MTTPSGDYYGPVLIEGYDQYGQLQIQQHFVQPPTYFWLGAEAEASWITVDKIVPVHAGGDRLFLAPMPQWKLRSWLSGLMP